MTAYKEYLAKCKNCKTREDAMDLISAMEYDLRLSTKQYYYLRHLALECAYKAFVSDCDT